jgi:serine/threonine protein kinase
MIIDFGLSAFVDASQDSLSHSGMIVGTVRCMPPEQAGGNPHVTTAADVYALGTVLLYAAAGHYPYDGSRWEAIVAQVTNPQVGPDLSGAPAGLVPLLESMLAHEPEARPTLASVADACTALLAVAAITPADARLALIVRTAGADTSRAAGPLLSPSIEAMIEALSPSSEAAEQASPLDAAPVTPEEEAVAGPEPAVVEQTAVSPPDATPAGPTSKPEQARQRPGRPAASSRVAQELRVEYAVHPSL